MIDRLSNGVSIQNSMPNGDKSPIELKVSNPIINDNINTNQSIENELIPTEKAMKLIDSLNKIMETSNTNLKFKFHEKLREYYVTIVNSNDEVVREIPSKKLMDIFAAMQDFVGLIVDRKI